MKKMLAVAMMVVAIGAWAEGELTSQEPAVRELDFESVKARAENGDAVAMGELSYRYVRGVGVRVNKAEANRWMATAASNGLERAIGVCYSNGIGVEKDPKEALKWYRKAADKGDICAMYNIWACCHNKRNRQLSEEEVSPEEAMRLLRFAADQGLEIAMDYLGRCYENGQGVEQDINEAIRWYRKAADKGDAVAMEHLAGCYELEAEKLRKCALEHGIYIRRIRGGLDNASRERRQGDKASGLTLRRQQREEARAQREREREEMRAQLQEIREQMRQERAKRAQARKEAEEQAQKEAEEQALKEAEEQ